MHSERFIRKNKLSKLHILIGKKAVWNTVAFDLSKSLKSILREQFIGLCCDIQNHVFDGSKLRLARIWGLTW